MTVSWKNSVFYQIYPRSFMDTTGNGTGDLRGITEKLEYVASLGVDGIWISPFFKSPQKDYGYDVSDYRAIDPLFGTLDDFDVLLEKAHSLGLKIIVDLVLSHTSNEHPWFSDPAKKDWYVWADAKADGSPPNNWVSIFEDHAWEWSEAHQQYYLHNFLKEQPDLNYHNPAVKAEALSTIKFWLDRGVDGFRLDVINFCYHDLELRDNPTRPKDMGSATQFEGDDPYSRQAHIYDKSRPEMIPFLHEIRALMDQYLGTFTIGEIGDDNPYKMAAEYTAGSDKLNMTYNPQIMAGTNKALRAGLIRAPIEEFLQHGKGHPAWAFSNHDVVRGASRWLDHSDGFSHNPALSKMLIALLGTLHGTIFMYQGEELGLPEAKLNFDQLRDPWGQRLWPTWQGRDGCRTPMPWNEHTPNGWLPVPEAHRALSVEMQEIDANSTLNFTRNFLTWRKTQPALLNGDITFHDTGGDTMLSFTRHCEEQTLRCAFNLKDYSYKIDEE
jgi:alpha-glucosidase